MDGFDIFVTFIFSFFGYLFLSRVVKPVARWVFDSVFSSPEPGSADTTSAAAVVGCNTPKEDGVVRMLRYVRTNPALSSYAERIRALTSTGNLEDISTEVSKIIFQKEVMQHRVRGCFDILAVTPRNLTVLICDAKTGDESPDEAMRTIDSMNYDDLCHRVQNLVARSGQNLSLAFSVAELYPELAVIHTQAGDARLKYALAGKVHASPWPPLRILYALALHVSSLPGIATFISFVARFIVNSVPSVETLCTGNASLKSSDSLSHTITKREAPVVTNQGSMEDTTTTHPTTCPRRIRDSCERRLTATDFHPEIIAWLHAYHRLNVTLVAVSVDLRRASRAPNIDSVLHTQRTPVEIKNDTSLIHSFRGAWQLWTELIAAQHKTLAPRDTSDVETAVVEAKIILERSMNTERISAPIYAIGFELEHVDYATWRRPTPYETASAIHDALCNSYESRYFYTYWLLRGLPLCFRESITYHREPFDFPAAQWPKYLYMWFMWKRVTFRVLRGIQGPRYASYAISWALARSHEDIDAMSAALGYDAVTNAPRFELYWGTQRRYLQRDISFLTALRSAILA